MAHILIVYKCKNMITVYNTKPLYKKSTNNKIVNGTCKQMRLAIILISIKFSITFVTKNLFRFDT